MFNDDLRESWQLAQIIYLIKSADQPFRSAKIRILSGEIWIWAIKSIIPVWVR